MVFHRYFGLFAFLALFFSVGNAQESDCTLDIGGNNAESVLKIFQLNELQQAKMEELRAEYSLTYEAVEDEMQKLLAEHPQSTPEELSTLAGKYKILQERIVRASQQADKKLLSTFNQRQYNLYLSLCHEAFRRPIVVTPVIYDGPSIEKK